MPTSAVDQPDNRIQYSGDPPSGGNAAQQADTRLNTFAAGGPNAALQPDGRVRSFGPGGPNATDQADNRMSYTGSVPSGGNAASQPHRLP
jgi:hypothetical protein